MLIRLSVGFLTLFFAACSHSSESKTDRPLVESDYKLVEDRKALESLRSEVPQEKQVDNDELAFLDNLFSDPLKDPGKIREQFNKAVTKKKEKFRKDKERARENFVRQERKDRESMNRELEQQRQEFRSRKADRDQTRAFFDELDRKRKDFNAAQKEKRDDFEATMRDDRKNFEDYMRERQNEFNSRHREFSRKRTEILKEKSDKKGNPP